MARKPTEKKKKQHKSKADKWLTADGLLMIAAWVRDGATDETLARQMQISRSTLSLWKTKHPVFAEAIRKSKEIVDVEVENALLKRATGYDYIEEVPMKTKREFWTEEGKCSEETIEVIEVTKHMPPDPRAAQYWLNNRKPDKWKASREDSAEGEGEVEVVIPEADKGQFE
jgi:hypothetical protein